MYKNIKALKKLLVLSLVFMSITFTGCMPASSTSEREDIILHDDIVEAIGIEADEIMYKIKPELDKLDVSCYTTEDECVVISLTEGQKSVLKKYYVQFTEKLQKEFSSRGENYKIEYSEDFTTIDFYYDEKISTDIIQEYAIYAEIVSIINQYMNGVENWQYTLNVSIYNAQTNTFIRSGSIDLPLISFEII